MKFLYVVSTKLPTEKAHGIQIVKTCEALADAGLEVTLMAPKRRNLIHQDIFDYYRVKKNFTYKQASSFHSLRLGSFGFFLQSVALSFQVFFYILKEKPEVLYSRDEIFLYFISFFNPRIFWETHDAKSSFFSRKVFYRSTGIVAITEGLRKFYEKKDTSLGEKITVIPDAVDLPQFKVREDKEECRKKLGLPTDVKIVLYAGHLYPWKGAHILAEASKNLEDILFVFVGGTDHDLTHFKEKYGQLKNVLLVGKKPHNEIPFYLKSADVLVLPNSAKEDISRLYTSPLKLFEYMASGVPIVSSDLPSLREILNERNAFFAKPDDSDSLAESIKTVFLNTEEVERKAKQALVDVALYTWEKRALNIKRFLFEKK